MKTSYSLRSSVSCIVVLTLTISFAILCKDSFAINPFSIEADTLQGVVINPPDANGRFGQSVSDAGDLNGDGFDDILIGAPEYQYPLSIGKAFIYFGGPVIETAPDLILTNGEYFFGGSVSKAGDVNGDGYADVIVGVGHYAFWVNEQVYVYFGGQNMDNIPDVVIPQGGKSVSSAGDVNGDGYSDVMTTDGIYLGGPSMDNIIDVAAGAIAIQYLMQEMLTVTVLMM
ncbi:MAG: FG-GAP repeat protein [Ignavibacteria bacterium]|nr:FG-GAP repeat protein [Ignavibacteria bacterium]